MTQQKPKVRTPLSLVRQKLPSFLSWRAVRAFDSSEQVGAIQKVERSGRVLLPTKQNLSRPSFYFISFVACVLIPAFASTIYLVFLASDIYIAEARFAVRKNGVGPHTSENFINAGSSSTSGSTFIDQEAHIVATYLRSRAAIEDIEKELNIIDIYRRPEADFWARLKINATREELVDYWNSMIYTYVDGPSGVVSVSAKAFRAEDAKNLVEAFIRSSERLANQISERARRDAMQRSEAEVRRSEALVRDALSDLRRYRDEEGLITPLMEATATSKLLAEAMSERIRLQNDYFVAVRAMTASSPTVQNVKLRLDALDSEIERLKGQLTSRSSENRSLSASIAKFEELELRRLFAEKMYTMSQDALERARLRAEQQSVYVSVFVPPYLPQEALFPERYSMSLIVFIGLFLLWSVGSLTVAAVEDHKL